MRIPFQVPRQATERVRRRRARASTASISSPSSPSIPSATPSSGSSGSPGCRAARSRPRWPCARGWDGAHAISAASATTSLGALSRDSLTREGVDIERVADRARRDQPVRHRARRSALGRAHGAVGSASRPDDGAGGGAGVTRSTSGRMLIVDCHETAAATQAARYARAAGIPTIVDVERVRPGIGDLLQHIDAIIAARGVSRRADRLRRARPRARGDGARVRRAAGVRHARTRRAVWRVQADARFARRPFTVDCVDRTGAGDAFRGGFAAGCLRAPDGRHRGRARDMRTPSRRSTAGRSARAAGCRRTEVERSGDQR